MSFNEEMFKLGNTGSAIRELFEFGKKRKAIVGDENVYDFSIGNPSVPTPKKVNDTIIKLLNEEDSTFLHGYTSAIGDPNTRKAISDNLNKTYNANTDPNLIYMTCGAAAALSITFRALMESEDDEILLLAPFFPEYRVFINNSGMKPVVVEPDSDLKIDLNRLEAMISPKTKGLVIDSPNNPTGAVLTEDEIIKISEILKKKELEYGHEIYLISDEPYREIIYDDIKYPFVTNYYDDSIVCYSFSKSLSLPGERIGYVLVNPKAHDAIRLYKAVCGGGRIMGFVCAPSIFQYMIKECVGITSDISVYKKNRDLLYDSLKEYGYQMIHPDGAFYLFMKSPLGDSNAFSELCKKYDVLVVPADSFGVKGYIRLSYCVDTDMIKRSLPKFKLIMDECREMTK